MTPLLRSVVAALLLAVPVVAETTGLIEGEGWQHLPFALTQLAGWLLLATVCWTLNTTSRAGRWGPRLVLAGVGLLALFAVLYLATYLATGEPAEAIFLTYLLGFPAMTVGGLLWARALRRTPWRVSAVGLALVGVLGFGAIALSADPFHDIALVGSYLAWIVVGLGATAQPATHPAATVSDASRSARPRPARPSPRRS